MTPRHASRDPGERTGTQGGHPEGERLRTDGGHDPDGSPDGHRPDDSVDEVGPVDPMRGPGALETLLRAGRENGLYTGAAVVVGTATGAAVRTVGTETSAGDTAVTPRTLFDVASLTKAVVTTTVTLRLVERGTVALTEQLGDHVPELAGTPRGAIPLRSLLTHTSGLPPYKSFPFGWESRDSLLASLNRSHLSPLADPDEWFVYSDLNFVHLGDVLRRVTDSTLEALAHEHVIDPLALEDAAMGPLSVDSGVAATHDYRWRDRTLRGEIHDYIGAVAGGESGNAGLFASAADLARVARTFLTDGEPPRTGDGELRLLAPGTVADMRRNAIPWADRPHGLGWRLAHDGDPAPGWSPSTFGHTGFTGCSLWIDPERTRFAVVLTNRLAAQEDPAPFARFRDRFHAVAGAIPRSTIEE